MKNTLFKKKYRNIKVDLTDTSSPLYSKVLEILKLQDISYDKTDDDEDDILDTSIKIEEFNNLNQEDENNDSNEEEVIEHEMEEKYVKSLRSSLFSEIFQEKFAKLLASFVSKIKNNKPAKTEFNKITKFIEECSTKEDLSETDKNIFLTIKDILLVMNEREDRVNEFNSLFRSIADNVEKFKTINKEKQEYIDYVIAAQNGSEAATNKIIEYMNIDIESLAKKFVQFNKRSEAYYSIIDDLKQEGYIGILNGIKKFKPQKSDNVKYYLRLWIKQSMISYLSSKNDIVKVPAHIKNIYIKIQKVIAEFTKDNKEYTVEDLAIALDLPVDKIMYVINTAKTYNVNTFSEIVSDELYEGMSLDDYDFIRDKGVNIEQDIFDNEEIKELQNVIKTTLNEEEQFILIHRYALFWVEALKLKDLWEKLQKTEERVRQIEERAKNIIAIRYFDKKYWIGFREKLKENNIFL